MAEWTKAHAWRACGQQQWVRLTGGLRVGVTSLLKDVRYIGCCGAYCRTCRALTDGTCRGCKLGYDSGERDINRSRCRMKVCCFKERALETCADCPECPECLILQDFYAKKGYKYKKYRQSLEFIGENGYASFIRKADDWKGPYGRLT
jgi:hypothetical protein